jgi:hypothetical protein
MTKQRDAVFEVSYSHVEAALVRTYDVQKRDLGRFRARITFLQKGGLLGVSPGKGKALRYNPDLIHRVIFATEMHEFGTPPQLVLETVADLWDRRICGIFERAATATMAPPGDDDIVMVLGSNSLMVGAWTSTAKTLPNVNGFPLHKLNDNLKLVMLHDKLPQRAVVVNLSARLRRFHAALADAHDLREPVPLDAPATAKRRRRKAR